VNGLEVGLQEDSGGTFNFFLEEDYRAMLKEKFAKDLEGLQKEVRTKEKPDKRKLGGILSYPDVLYGNAEGITSTAWKHRR
jgi:hypothetical protein